MLPTRIYQLAEAIDVRSILLVNAHTTTAQFSMLWPISKVLRFAICFRCKVSMNRNFKLAKKSYAMQRMRIAIARAVSAGSQRQKATAARWAAAWGLLCGIYTPGVRLKRSDLLGTSSGRPRVTLSDGNEAGVGVPMSATQQGLSDDLPVLQDPLAFQFAPPSQFPATRCSIFADEEIDKSSQAM